jgi:hypothetical protein
MGGARTSPPKAPVSSVIARWLVVDGDAVEWRATVQVRPCRRPVMTRQETEEREWGTRADLCTDVLTTMEQ